MANNLFNSVEVRKPNSNRFDLTHDVKMTCKMANLNPCLVMECLPGDKVTLGCDMFMRMAPMLAPPMHTINASVHYFFVPNRLTWDNWDKFIVDDEDAAAVMPTVNITTTVSTNFKAFLSMMGIPPINGTESLPVNALPFAAYQMICNEWYRNQNVVDEYVFELNDGANSAATFLTMRQRSWEKDYFTGSLPFAQKGAAVDMPAGDIYLKPDWATSVARPEWPNWKDDVMANNLFGGTTQVDDGFGEGQVIIDGFDSPMAYDPVGSLAFNNGTINEFRRAEQLQKWLELNARVGTRYVEYILGNFGVRSPDARMQRPEFITGVRAPLIISEVLNTTGTVDAPQGDMAGHGVAVTQGKVGSYFCYEHGFIIGVLSVMPKTAYMQGIPKHYLKRDPFDFGIPMFANLGEQEVLNAELYWGTIDDMGTFGYVPRYAEYKFMPSRVAGDFLTTLDFWHLARKFASLPLLNQAFVQMNATVDANRIFAVQDGTDYLWSHLLHRISVLRRLPRYGTPSI